MFPVLQTWNVLALCFLHSSSGNDGNSSYNEQIGLSRCYDCDHGSIMTAVVADGQGQTAAYTHNQQSPPNGELTPATARGNSNITGGFPPSCSSNRIASDEHVKEINCQNGVCYIRKEYNGLTYRGCADPTSLPADVKSEFQCQVQGVRPAVWWFCNGSLCNAGQLGDRCNSGGRQPNINTGENGNTEPSPSTDNSKPSALSPLYPSSSSSNNSHLTQAHEHHGNIESLQTVHGGPGLSLEKRNYASISDENGDRQTVAEPHFAPHQGHEIASLNQALQPESTGYVTSFESKQQQQQLSQQQQHQQQPQQQQQPKSSSAYSEVNYRKTLGHSDLKLEAAGQARSGEAGSPVSPMTHNANGNAESAYSDSSSAWHFFMLGLQSKVPRPQTITGNLLVVEAPRTDLNANPESMKTLYSAPASDLPFQKSGGAEYQPSTSGSEFPTQNGQLKNGGSNDVTDQTSAETAGFSQCNGHCADNPSGLFPIPSRPDMFIQCASGMNPTSGLVCQCCRPQRMPCPKSTTFDPVIKVCTTGTGITGAKTTGITGAETLNKGY